MKNQPDRNVLDEHREGNDSAESRGSDHREPQDNTGDGPRPLSSWPLPQDPHSPKGKDYADDPNGAGAEISDQGLNETVETNQGGTVAQYGLKGGPEGFDCDKRRAPVGGEPIDSRFNEEAVINDHSSREPLIRNRN